MAADYDPDAMHQLLCIVRDGFKRNDPYSIEQIFHMMTAHQVGNEDTWSSLDYCLQAEAIVCKKNLLYPTEKTEEAIKRTAKPTIESRLPALP